MFSAHTHTTNSPISYQRRFLRIEEVMLRTGFRRSHIYNMMGKGEFPANIKLGVRAVAWDSVEVDQWISERLEFRNLRYPAAAVN